MVDKNGFDDYFRRFHKELVLLMTHYHLDLGQAEDVVQEAFVKMYHKNPHFDHPLAARSWLLKTCTHLALDRFRWAKRWRLSDTLVDELPSIDRAHQWEINQDLKSTLAMLGDKERMAVLLQHLMNMDQKEVAEVLAIPVGTVKSLVSRAMKKMSQKEQNR